MFQGGDPHSFETSSYASSVISNGFSVETSSQISNVSRPSGRSIYMQRKEYVENINKQMGCCQYRVEHLFTCDMDSWDVRLDDCIDRLKLLEATGAVWSQEMILQVQDGSLRLIDIETQEELERHPISSVSDVQAVLDSCVYNSLLTVSMQKEGTSGTSIFMFQCSALRADYIKRDIERAINHRKDDCGDNRQPRDNLRAIMAAKMNGALQNNRPPSEEWDRPERPPMEWDAPDYDDSPVPTPTPATPLPTPPTNKPEPVRRQPQPRQPSPPPPQRTPTPQPYTERERNVDILNHVINDIEAFMGRVAAVAPKEDKKKNKKKKNKKKKCKVIVGLPSPDEFEVCFQKIKFGFNLLGELTGKINDPSAPDLVHVFFSILTYLVDYSPEELPPSVVVPLLTPECIRLLSEEATIEEDQFWQTLGDAWNIPSTQWPEEDDDIPDFIPVFDDDWQPQDVMSESQPQSKPQSKSPSQPPSQPSSRQPSQRTRNEPVQTPWKPPAEVEENGEVPANYLRVIFDFTARNQRELSISKGEVVQLLDMSKQWWKVRNDIKEEGYVPNNVLEPLYKKDEEPEPVVATPNLTKKSKPSEVKAWLEYKGFNKITVRCLSMVSGASLLGMTREELKMVCPDEGGRVFFQLQNVKSANALASEIRRLE
ncbi:epidermal growth factor receptor kinase substrate 8-like protein 3 [Clupea harengus]|uniref:Epidermal growth factor receptor kinase substrate 8-like protein 3 n=1 Tax=Clupea harengus TaxID=7950 RepID=A0A6P8FHT5_CLUHA|nr:epidermal growth factor receptor kinase substrate 8-like protein 3 [Clupea harengus]XP_031423181.1 epidermal growth factor receptor kinase substrate 8-like protein 3 [Clupea harengus]